MIEGMLQCSRVQDDDSEIEGTHYSNNNYGKVQEGLWESKGEENKSEIKNRNNDESVDNVRA